jgi:hypothetical protein
MEMDKKRYGSQVRGNGEGYQGSGGSVELTQGGLGCGKGKAVHSKAPTYDTYGKVEKVVHGHTEVGEKI